MRNHRLELKRLASELPEDEIELRENFKSGITGAMRYLAQGFVGQYMFWDADDFNRHAFHSIASKEGIRLLTKKHKTHSCFVIMRKA